jgi:hypothetical protein
MATADAMVARRRVEVRNVQNARTEGKERNGKEERWSGMQMQE